MSVQRACQIFAAEWRLPLPANISVRRRRAALVLMLTPRSSRGDDDHAACVFPGCFGAVRGCQGSTRPLLSVLVSSPADPQPTPSASFKPPRTFNPRAVKAVWLSYHLCWDRKRLTRLALASVSLRAWTWTLQVAPVMDARPSLEPRLRRGCQLSAVSCQLVAAPEQLPSQPLFFCAFSIDHLGS